MQAAIEAHAVTCRTRGGEVTVRDVSLTVGQGELVAVLGSSGSGKTTLLDALSGVRPPTSGTVSRHPGGPAGYVPAGESLPSVLPLARALRYAAALRGIRDPARAAAGALVTVGLTAAAGTPAGALNPGEHKRAVVAAELLARPAALFLDEPATDLDPAQAAQLLRLLRGLSDSGMTVLLTTNSPIDADRCDKVAVFAAGGHLAFFGTPAAALGYFGADSLEEIYERLSGIGDPAAAWSRRFFYYSAMASASAPVPTTPRAPGPALLIPDQAGPHSAGRPSMPFSDERHPGDWGSPGVQPGRDLDLNRGERDPYREDERVLDGERDRGPGDLGARVAGYRRGQGGEHGAGSGSARPPGPARQLPVLLTRNAEVLVRARRWQAVLAAAPLAVLLVFSVLLGTGALDGPATGTLAWAVLGGLVTGLACELPMHGPESGVLRRERFAGLRTSAFIAAKATVLLPVMALADVLILLLPAIAGRLHDGFGLSYLAVFAASAIGLGAATASLFSFSRGAAAGGRTVAATGR